MISGINSSASKAALSNNVNVEHSGKTLNVAWHYSDGVLTLSGEGATDDYKYDYSTPWNKIRDNIKKVVVKDGVTAIGTRAFMNCKAIEEVELPDTLLKISEYSFSIGLRKELPFCVLYIYVYRIEHLHALLIQSSFCLYCYT